MAIDYGIMDLITGGAGGAMQGLGTGLAIANPAIGIPVGLAVGIASAVSAISGSRAKRKEYKAIRKAIKDEYRRTERSLEIKRALQKRQTRGGQKGIGGGHDIRSGMGTIQDIAMGRTKELGDIEQQAAADKYYTARAIHRARKKHGGVAGVLDPFVSGMRSLAGAGLLTPDPMSAQTLAGQAVSAFNPLKTGEWGPGFSAFGMGR